MEMKVAKRIRINARLPDHDGKFRDEITQEFSIELDGDADMLAATIEKIDEKLEQGLQEMLNQINELGGRNYTEG